MGPLEEAPVVAVGVMTSMAAAVPYLVVATRLASMATFKTLAPVAASLGEAPVVAAMKEVLVASSVASQQVPVTSAVVIVQEFVWFRASLGTVSVVDALALAAVVGWLIRLEGFLLGWSRLRFDGSFR